MNKYAMIILIVVITIIIIIGTIIMGNRILKEEKFGLDDIEELKIISSRADVNIYTTDEKEIRVVQYSKSKVKDEELFKSNVSDNAITISSDGDNIMHGISYSVYIPESYDGKLFVNIENGNVNYDLNAKHIFENVNIKVNNKGNINLLNIKVKDTSYVYTKEGFINVKIAEKMIYKVNGKNESGDIDIKSKYKDGDISINLETVKGNITVE